MRTNHGESPSDASGGPLRGRARLVDLQRVSHGLYRPRRGLPGSREELLRDLEAWLLVLPDEATFTHLTAARVRGWEMPPLMPADLPVFAAVGADGRSPQRPGLVCSRLTCGDAPSEIARLPVAGSVEVLLRAARDLALLDLVVLVDSARRRGEVDVDRLREVLGSSRPGVVPLRRAWDLSDPRAESAGESLLRVFHRVMGVDVEPQVTLLHDGRFVARGDLLIRGTRKVQEYDGAGHRDRAQHGRDLRRERALLDATYERRGYTLFDLTQHAAVAMQELDTMLGRRRDVRRLRVWNRLVRDSTLSEEGRRRVLNRWFRLGPPVHCGETT